MCYNSVTERGVIMAMSDEIKKEHSKVKDMTFKEKCSYIWDYYKIPIIIVIAVIILASYFIRDIRDNSRPLYLDALVLNSTLPGTENTPLSECYVDYSDIDLNKYRLFIETGLSLTDEYYNQNSMVTMQKILSMVSTNELDVIIAPVSCIKMYEDMEAYIAIDTILDDTAKEIIKDKELDYYYADYTSSPIGIDVSSLKLIKEAYPSDLDEPIIFTVLVNSSRQEHSIEFLNALLQ